MNRIFVYGSIKRGFHNHGRMVNNGATEFLGTAVTTDSAFALVNFGGHYPGAFRTNDCPVSLGGEVYSVDDDVVARLDRMEQHPWRYRRELVDITGHGDCWVYLLNQDNPDNHDERTAPRVASGNWTHDDAYSVPAGYMND